MGHLPRGLVGEVPAGAFPSWLSFLRAPCVGHVGAAEAHAGVRVS